MEISHKNIQRCLTVKPKTWNCKHPTVELDMDSRLCYCSSCEKIIDPFDFLLTVATKETLLDEQLERLKKEVSELQRTKNQLLSKN